MPGMEFIPLLVGYLFALAATALFVYGLFRLVRRLAIQERLIEFAKALGLIREHGNPILVPRTHEWEAGGVMNPAAVEAGGRVHLFYRAVGGDGVSRIGYASSADGARFDERLPYPVFALAGVPPDAESFARHSGLMASGGSFAGVEDPRAVIINDTMHLTFNAFAGWNSLRIGLTTIKVGDLLTKRWKWTPPVFLSSRGEVQKSWMLFPEKVEGRFAVLHSLHSGSREKVLVDYVDELRDNTGIKSPYYPSENQSVWDARLRGAGPPPIKTKKGWLLLYHANDAREPSRYKLGALLLDLLDPRKVIARAPVPVLSPDAPYENGGKPGIVYACGAVTRGDTLHVYYGGGDSVVCAAKTSLSSLLAKLLPLSSRYQTIREPVLA
ncbi:MAG: hypothetical protein WBK28_03115 [Minisyncoccia bacterium]